VIDAICSQVRTLSFAHTTFFTSDSAERLAEFLLRRAPPGFGRGRAAFLGSGSEAMEAAIKLTRQYFVERGEAARVRFIARRQSYHGNTLGALALSGHAARRAIYEPLLMDVQHVSPCFPYRFQEEGESAEVYVQRLADELESTLLSLGPETVAAFVAEPVVGATLGCVAPAPGYFQQVREVCDKYGVLLIADEVMCGMGRCGAWFTIGDEGISPDLVVLAKGLGAGYVPISAMLASERVVATISAGSRALNNGHTYMGHPLACAAALAVVTVIDQEQLLARVKQQGTKLAQLLAVRFREHPQVGDIRGRGLFLALELVADRAHKTPFEREKDLASKLRTQALMHGLVCYPGSGTADGVRGDHVLLAPPYIIDDPQLEQLTDKLSRALSAALV